MDRRIAGAARRARERRRLRPRRGRAVVRWQSADGGARLADPRRLARVGHPRLPIPGPDPQPPGAGHADHPTYNLLSVKTLSRATVAACAALVGVSLGAPAARAQSLPSE